MRKNRLTDPVWEQLKDLVADQQLAVLATHDHGQPYTSLVAFAATPDLRQLFFVTGDATRKYANLAADPRAAMMIDNRSNSPADIADAMAATATGSAAVVSGDALSQLEAVYRQKHPHLAEFMKAPSTRMMRLEVACYYVVNRFQNVVEIHMR